MAQSVSAATSSAPTLCTMLPRSAAHAFEPDGQRQAGIDVEGGFGESLTGW